MASYGLRDLMPLEHGADLPREGYRVGEGWIHCLLSCLITGRRDRP